MTINGNIKFFSDNKINEDCSITCTSANTVFLPYLYDNKRTTRLTSISSNDATPEVWTITFNGAISFDRIFIDNHNIKSGTLQYWNGSTYVDFSSAIAWSANSSSTNYYEFNSVTTTSIRLTMNTTITTNDEKRVGSLLVLTEIGTLQDNPVSMPINFIDRKSESENVEGGSILTLFGRKFYTEMELSDAGATDMSLILTLKDYATPFYVFPCGGTAQLEVGFRLQDIYLVNFVGDLDDITLNGDVYGLGQSITVRVKEV